MTYNIAALNDASWSFARIADVLEANGLMFDESSDKFFETPVYNES